MERGRGGEREKGREREEETEARPCFPWAHLSIARAERRDEESGGVERLASDGLIPAPSLTVFLRRNGGGRGDEPPPSPGPHVNVCACVT